MSRPESTPGVATRVRNSSHTLPESASFLLDLIRFPAAIAVFITHVSDSPFPTGLHGPYVIGTLAVPVFFVLSGFVIRFVTRSREHTLSQYLIDRASRIYSVVLPAMVLTLLAAALCRTINPAYYELWWGEISNHVVQRVVMNTIFLSQAWGHNVIPFINIPFWSLSYEVPYYLLYGLLFYLRGARRILATLLLALIIGPQILFLLPVWWMGCWVYDLYHAMRRTRSADAVRWFTLALFGLWAVVAIVGPKGSWALPWHALEWFAALPNPLLLLHQPVRRATMQVFGVGIASAVVLFALLLLSDWIVVPAKHPAVRFFRRLADGTFTIYLMHYPLLAIVGSLGWFHPTAYARTAAIALAIGILLVLSARPTDLLKNWMRQTLRNLFSIQKASAA